MRQFTTIEYEVESPIATIRLNRPDSLNAILEPMPSEIEGAIETAGRDDNVSVIVLKGNGRAFCAGFDFSTDLGETVDDGFIGSWDPGRDLIATTTPFIGPIPKFMSIWRSPKPVIAQIHGWCVGGGSDMALCADLIVAADTAQIGTPYSRVWGCYLSGMWIYRLGLTKVKEVALTGRPLTGVEAADLGLINRVVPEDELEDTVRELALQLGSIPKSQLAAMKLIVNQTYDNMGLQTTQYLGAVLDGYMRNTPEGKQFLRTAFDEGVRSAIEQRDAPFGDYSQARG